MRAKVLFAIALLALLILAPAVYFRIQSSEPVAPLPPPAAQATVTADNTATTASAMPQILRHTANTKSGNDLADATDDDPAADLNSPDHPAYVAKRESALQQLGLNRAPGSLQTILKNVSNADPAIREAALDATKEYNDPDAIPTLRNEMAWAQDPAEKVAIQNVIAFLELPPMTLNARGGIDESGISGIIVH